jgi:plasmid replication initiation protein
MRIAIKKCPNYAIVIIEVKIMSDFKETNKVVQSNDLVQLARWNLSTNSLKIFKTLVSCIDTNHPSNTVALTKNELYSMLDQSEDTNYTYLRKQIKELQRQIIDIYFDDKIVSVSLMPKVVYERNVDIIKCTFSDDLMPYLVNLKERFLQYDVTDIKGFNSKYGLIMYEYLLSRERQERDKRHTYMISVDDLRRLTDTQNKFKLFKDFRTRVIETAVKDINQSGVGFLCDYETDGGRGRKVHNITFKLRVRTSATEKKFGDIHNKKLLSKRIR